jgi:hypothetical protein
MYSSGLYRIQFDDPSFSIVQWRHPLEAGRFRPRMCDRDIRVGMFRFQCLESPSCQNQKLVTIQVKILLNQQPEIQGKSYAPDDEF